MAGACPAGSRRKAGFPGCYDGFVTQLADEWLGSLDAAAKAEVEVFSCGPTPMLEAMAKVAAKHDVPCQVSLEEFMACAVGGCAGCTVKVNDARRTRDEARVRGRAGVRLARRVRLGLARFLRRIERVALPLRQPDVSREPDRPDPRSADT